jgi:hypothetical protein
MFNELIFKNNKYVSHTDKSIILFLSDIKIKSIFKFKNNNGYLLSIYIPRSINSEIIDELQHIDTITFNDILDNSNKWFHKQISEDELKTLYIPSFCNQSVTMNVILTNNTLTKCIFNNKHINDIEELISLFKNIKHLKECLINLHIQHNGLYIYKESAQNKWIIKNINITDIAFEKCYWIKEDIEDKLKDNIEKITQKTNAKIAEYKQLIKDLEDNNNKIRDSFEELQKQKKWEHSYINNINKNIVVQEDLLKN